MAQVQPLPGDFAVTSVKGRVGFLISVGEWLNGSRFGHWDHAFVYVGDDQLVEAEPGGARLASLDEYQGRVVAWSTGHIELTEEQRAAVVTAARGYIGVPYSAADYMALALWHFHVRIGWARRVMGSRASMICSELTDAAYDDAGVHLFADGREPGDVTPADLALLIKA
ncbi:hypothetical protein [Streptacidiphilus neutrinimicus]|uniref:hypothetical protein n=1 Tax=Streptacidiphilus neutrinimicus TaxID=105420 RepID=UPI0005A66A64|nr:hypothetical protein [Streptacidiphilus neutrinimicus]